jgi:hypothetical protein
MNSLKLLHGFFGATVFMVGVAWAEELPPGPDQEMVSRECQACHDLSMVLAATGLTREGWNDTIEEMTGYGLRVTPQERQRILDYLSNYLGRSTPTPTPVGR